jgi:superfamily II DNA helicase RecQ
LRAAESGKTVAHSSHDFAKDAYILIKAAQEAKGQIGLTTVILILRASTSKRVNQKNREIGSYGGGRHRPEAWWKSIGNSQREK